MAIEVITQHAGEGGLAETMGVDYVAHWRFGIAEQLAADGLPPASARIEAVLAAAMFTGLVSELLTGRHPRQTGRALQIGIARLEQLAWTSAGLSDHDRPAGTPAPPIPRRFR